MSAPLLTVALPKGRLQREAAALFIRAYGVDPAEALSATRRLSYDAPEVGLRFLSVRAGDVASYVEHGAADLGVAGLDVLREHRPDLYEPLDLNMGVCRLIVAAPAPEGALPTLEGLARHRPLRVGTKYPHITSLFLAERGLAGEIVTLHGAVELAPLLGLCDVIVDITETGETLRQNGLEIIDQVMGVNARLVVNRVSLKRRPDAVRGVTEALRQAQAAAATESG